jgi:quinol monooxygenase YgiN
MIHLVVTMLIKPEAMEKFLEAVARLRPLVLSETGCITYTYLREIQTGNPRQESFDPNRITLVECWATQTNLDAHLESTHMKAFSEEISDYRKSVSLRIAIPAL